MSSPLDEAREIVVERGGDYGPVFKHWTRTAEMWSALLQGKLAEGKRLTAEDVGRLYIADKLARDAHRGKPDNLVDICGYAHLLSTLPSRELNEAHLERERPVRASATGRPDRTTPPP